MMSFRFITVGVVYIYFWFNTIIGLMRLAIHVPHPVWRILYVQRVFHVQEYCCVCIALLLKRAI